MFHTAQETSACFHPDGITVVITSPNPTLRSCPNCFPKSRLFQYFSKYNHTIHARPTSSPALTGFREPQRRRQKQEEDAKPPRDRFMNDRVGLWAGRDDDNEHQAPRRATNKRSREKRRPKATRWFMKKTITDRVYCVNLTVKLEKRILHFRVNTIKLISPSLSGGSKGATGRQRRLDGFTEGVERPFAQNQEKRKIYFSRYFLLVLL